MVFVLSFGAVYGELWMFKSTSSIRLTVIIVDIINQQQALWLRGTFGSLSMLVSMSTWPMIL